MSFLNHIRGGLANAQHEVSKHVNTDIFHRAIENVQGSIHAGSAAPQLNYLRSIATGFGNKAAIEKQGNLHNATPRLAEAARDDHLHVEIKITRAEDTPMRAISHAEAGNTVADADIVGECSSIATERHEVSEPTCEKPTTITCWKKCTCKSHCAEGLETGTTDPNHGFLDGAQAAARRLGKAAWENPVLAAATVATGAGLLVVAAPAVVTVPFMGAAGAAGFTPAGIAATSAASAMHASIGNVAAGSLFATVQSAATGGYGVAVLTGAAQAAGGAVAGAGASVGGIVTLLKGKQRPETKEKRE
ncbi:hypothetical protein V8C42DRAFT_311054 [Trichoderma barbatum]